MLLQAWVQASRPGAPEPAIAGVWALLPLRQGWSSAMMPRGPWGLLAAAWEGASRQVGVLPWRV